MRKNKPKKQEHDKVRFSSKREQHLIFQLFRLSKRYRKIKHFKNGYSEASYCPNGGHVHYPNRLAAIITLDLIKPVKTQSSTIITRLSLDLFSYNDAASIC